MKSKFTDVASNQNPSGCDNMVLNSSRQISNHRLLHPRLCKHGPAPDCFRQIVQIFAQKANIGLEQWPQGQNSGTISIIEFGLRVYSTRYTAHNAEINIECPQ